jgi:hypothetical protein
MSARKRNTRAVPITMIVAKSAYRYRAEALRDNISQL